MRKINIIFLFLFLVLVAHAQQKTIDSLRKLLNVNLEDTSRVLMISQLSQLYFYSKPDSALLLAQQGVQISKNTQFLKGEAYCLSDEGVVFSLTGNYPRALSTMLRSIKIGENINDRFIIQKGYHDIAIVYSNEGDYRQSINYIKRAKTAAEANGDKRALGIVFLDLGDCYEKLNILDTALVFTRQAQAGFNKLKDPDLIGAALSNLGNIYAKMNLSDTAMHYYRISIAYTMLSGDDDGICETSLGIAKLFRQSGQSDSSLFYARKSIAAGWHGGFTLRVLAASQFLNEYFEKRGQLDSAYRYQKMSIVAKDSLYSQEKTKEMQNLNFAERQRQQDIETQNAAYRTKIRYYLLGGVIVFLLALAFVFWRNNGRNEKAKRLLQMQKEQIQATLAELKITQNHLVQSAKMASLGELTAGIAHEIQNPLNFVNNFSEVSVELIDEMQSELKSGDKNEAIAISEDVKQNLVKIRDHGKRADFIVKGMLEHSRTSTGKMQITNLNMLADEYLKLSYHGFRAKNKNFKANLVTSFDPALPELNVVQQEIGRVLANLFNNCFYAVHQKAKAAGTDYEPTVEVITISENGYLLIKVKDNGTGIPASIRDKVMQPFFTTKPTGDATGLGLSLSYDIIAKGHNGDIKINSRDGEFTELIISLPIV